MRKHIQRYHCPSCNHHFQASYQKIRISPEQYAQVAKLNNEGCGISSIGRLLRISKSSVQRMLLKIAGNMEVRHSQGENESYEIDELRTFCGNKKKECWLIYAINRKSRQVIDFFVDRRTKENVNKLISSVLQLKPQCIYSDGLNLYKSLIPYSLHKIYSPCTNHNFTLRTHLKRLGRKRLWRRCCGAVPVFISGSMYNPVG